MRAYRRAIRNIARAFGVDPRRVGPDVLLMRRSGDPDERLAAWSSMLRRQRLRYLLDLYGIDVALDVGANVGQFGECLREIGFSGKIISFEPIAEVASELKRRAAKDPDWEVHQLGLGDFDGTATINVSRWSVFSSLLSANDVMATRFGHDAEVRRTEQIPIRRLDTLTTDILRGVRSARLMLKLDTQGYDLNVVRGAKELMERVLVLQSELPVIPIYRGMASLAETLDAFMKLGFSPAGMYPISLSADGAHVIEFDGLLSRG